MDMGPRGIEQMNGRRHMTPDGIFNQSTHLPGSAPDCRLSPLAIGNGYLGLRRPLILLWLTGLLLWLPTPAVALGLAQGETQGTSRATLLPAQRQANLATVVPQERSAPERALHRITDGSRFMAKIMRGWKGFHFAAGDFPAGAGFVFGVGYTKLALGAPDAESAFPNRVDVQLVAAYSSRKYYQVGFDLTLRDLGGAPLSVAFHGQASEFPQQDFFGLGRASRQEDRTNYLLRSLEGGVDLWFEPLRRFRLGGGATYLSPSIGSGRDARFLSTQDRFDETTLPGFQRQPDFWRYHGFMDYDSRDQPSNPRAGGFYGARLSNFRDRHLDTFHFRRFEADLQQYLPLPNRDRVVALRANLVMTDFSSGEAVPFYYLPTLGGSKRLRGFREFRFRDLNSLLLTAEYRWEAWQALDLALFVDAGKVTFDHADLHFKDLEATYGFGFRFHSSDALLLRLDFAFSPEGFIPLWRYNHVF